VEPAQHTDLLANDIITTYLYNNSGPIQRMIQIMNTDLRKD
jgi:hypothetical protein